MVAPSARIFSWAILRRQLDPALPDLVGEIVALAEPTDVPGVRLVGNVVGVAAEDLELGLEVVVDFVEADGTPFTLPIFRR